MNEAKEKYLKDLYESIRINRNLIEYMNKQIERINKDIEKRKFEIRHDEELINFMLDL
jgi:hypothetical protein